ncbi:hypothetical protein [Kribbella soli]|uniref:Uncharacterized protein n=1 Tax=Kribbella soli TaxID=1124743 RepID=A0A4R0H0B4_9ACTN|nr:hypothetical protein [Kribbella soli]TCC03965.1 hypothetical protein E0H45_33220 [Kribbella soli]
MGTAATIDKFSEAGVLVLARGAVAASEQYVLAGVAELAVQVVPVAVDRVVADADAGVGIVDAVVAGAAPDLSRTHRLLTGMSAKGCKTQLHRVHSPPESEQVNGQVRDVLHHTDNGSGLVIYRNIDAAVTATRAHPQQPDN